MSDKSLENELEIARPSELPASLRGAPPTSASDGTREKSSLAGRAGIVGLGTLVSRILGLGRDLVLAARFSRADTDLFFVAFTIPNALRQLLAEGALSSAFVPVLSALEETEGSLAGARFYARMRSVMLVVLVAVCALGTVAARPLCELFAQGFHARPGAFERTVTLTRWLFPYLLFMGLAALGAGALQTRRRFAVAAFAPGLLNVAMIAAAIVLPAILLARGIDPIFALAVGALVGGALQVAAQIPALRSAGFTGFVAPTFDDPKVREVVRRIAPMTFGLMIYELDLILSRRFLSSAGEGANSYFYYAQRLCDFPQGIFSLALATATLPSLSKLVARGDRRAVASTFAHALNLALFVALPATALLVGLARPIVVAMFGRGEFDATSVDGTSTALIAQGFGVWTVAVVRQVVPLFYALGDTKTPVIVSGLDLVAFIAIAVGLTPTLGHVGVSLAVTGSSLVQAALLVFALRKRLPELRGRDVLPSAVRTTIASVAAVVVAVIVARALAAFGVRGVRSMLALAIEGATFAIAFVVTARLVGSAELDALATAALRRLRRRSPPAVS